MPNHQRHLAWHETLEIHELVAFQANGLIKLKKLVREINEPTLQSLYLTAITSIEKNLRELLPFFPYAPVEQSYPRQEAGFYAGDLLGLAKTTVRNYAIAITETATPKLREVLIRQLNAAIQLHGQVYSYMYKHGYYPSYDLHKLLANDVQNAQKALNMRF